jgi:hypothetical protein
MIGLFALKAAALGTHSFFFHFRKRNRIGLSYADNMSL